MLVGKLLVALQHLRVLYLHAHTAAHDAHFLDPLVTEARHLPPGNGLNAGDFAHVVLFLKQADGLQRRGAGQGIAHKGRPVHQGLGGVVAVKAVEHLPAGHSGRVADVAAGERLAQNQNVRLHQVGHKAVARAAEAGGHLIEDQQHVVLVAQFPRPLQKGDVVHTHTARALEQRLHNKAVQPLVAALKGLFQRINAGGNVDHVGLFAIGLQHKVIILVVAHLHGLEGIAVVGVLQRQHLGAALVAPVHVVLQGHFQADLHRHTAGIREKAAVQVAGQPLFQLGRELLHRLMGQAAQHHMAELPGLVLNGPGQGGVLVAVDDAPPGGH